ncbi:MAG: tRNA (N6-isopentenyl adenosine(37)-C2)-methylthiotransferase MiaB, partial [Rhodobiaceae bacterium]|nr:tRNA (N6-isopentenyl adenosine(37)-C2)-methylthiotransferase MiaB [Rhodobiaceae bacterium]
TYGCQMNVYDSERMADVLSPLGYEMSDTSDDADVMILNTCHIREKAAEEVYSELGRIRKIKQQRTANGKTTVIGVAGCVAQAEGEEMLARAPIVDLLVGPQAYHRLPDLIRKIEAGERGLLEVDFPADDKFEKIPAAKSAQIIARGPTAFVTVQEGCDKFCTFCVVPYTRGAEYSRPLSQVLEEAHALVDAGVREITLLGQNVNAYHGEDSAGKDASLADLIRILAKMDGLSRIRYITSHPRDMTDDLIDAHCDTEKLMPYLHLPVQSGSTRILQAMNRQHTAESYVRLVERIRAGRPDLAMSSDFIVGFPGETEADFQATLDIVKEIKYAQAYSFKYSPRAGTPAASHEDPVPEEVMVERLKRLQAVLNEQQVAFNKSCIGKTLPVLLDRRGKREGQLVGRSPYLQSVYIQASDEAFGEMVNVEIETGMANSLTGHRVPGPM